MTTSPSKTQLPGAWMVSDPLTTQLCPLYGFKCPTNTLCECSEYCPNGEAYIPFQVMEDEIVLLLKRQLLPGTYCLPKGVGTCNLETSIPVFSLTGWSCIPRNRSIHYDNKLLACQHEEAADNSLNYLYDYKLLKKLDFKEVRKSTVDYNETLAKNGQSRYRCVCGSKTYDGKKMTEILKFHCAPDYCVSDIPNPSQFVGWNPLKNVCECGAFEHEDPSDETSPCLVERTRIGDNESVLIGRTTCMTNVSFYKSPVFCPKDEGALSFKSWILLDSDPIKYLERHKDKILPLEEVAEDV